MTSCLAQKSLPAFFTNKYFIPPRQGINKASAIISNALFQVPEGKIIRYHALMFYTTQMNSCKHYPLDGCRQERRFGLLGGWGSNKRHSPHFSWRRIRVDTCRDVFKERAKIELFFSPFKTNMLRFCRMWS